MSQDYFVQVKRVPNSVQSGFSAQHTDFIHILSGVHVPTGGGDPGPAPQSERVCRQPGWDGGPVGD
jgi:hypothetical protein